MRREISSSASFLPSLFFWISREADQEDYGRKEVSLSLRDILPINPKQYDKHRAPKFLGQPTIVYFHVTVLSLDSINEESMVSRYNRYIMTKFYWTNNVVWIIVDKYHIRYWLSMNIFLNDRITYRRKFVSFVYKFWSIKFYNVVWL